MSLAQVSADSVRSAAEQVFSAPRYDWTPLRDPFRWLREALQAVGAWLAELAERHPAAYWALLGLMAGVLVAILAHFAILVWRALRPRAITVPAASASVAHARTRVWHLAEARRLVAVGRYAEAMAHQFAALVIELDGRGIVRYRPSKTPFEYGREARLDEPRSRSMADAISTLYGHLFAGAPCRADDVRRFATLADHVLGAHAA